MKWIGQHIWSLISRFRSDVYLEDVDAGTIASGGNLGLDSNNKIVKATVSGGGTPTDITVANEGTDTTCFPLFTTGPSGNLGAKSGTNLTFNSSSGLLTATSFADGNGDALTTATAALSDATAISVALG